MEQCARCISDTAFAFMIVGDFLGLVFFFLIIFWTVDNVRKLREGVTAMDLYIRRKSSGIIKNNFGFGSSKKRRNDDVGYEDGGGEEGDDEDVEDVSGVESQDEVGGDNEASNHAHRVLQVGFLLFNNGPTQDVLPWTS